MMAQTEAAKKRTVGETLRDARQQQNLSLDALGTQLRVRPEYLQAIEAGRPQALPGQVYALGFVRSYARHFGLDAEKLVEQFRLYYDKLQSGSLGRALPENRARKNSMFAREEDALGASARVDVTSLGGRMAAPSGRAENTDVLARYGAQEQRRGPDLASFFGAALMVMMVILLGGAALSFVDEAGPRVRQAALQVAQLAQTQWARVAPYMRTPGGAQSAQRDAPPAAARAASSEGAEISSGGRTGSAARAAAAPSARPEADAAPIWPEGLETQIAARQDTLLLRPRPVSVMQVLQNYNERTIPDFLADAEIEIRASAPNWLQVEDASGRLLYAREMNKGASFALKCCSHFVLATRDAGTLHYVVNGKTLGTVGEPGEVLTGKIVYSVKLARAAFAR